MPQKLPGYIFALLEGMTLLNDEIYRSNKISHAIPFVDVLLSEIGEIFAPPVNYRYTWTLLEFPA